MNQIETLQKEINGTITINTTTVEELKSVVQLQADKMSKFITMPLTDARIQDSSNFYKEVNLIKSQINDQVEVILRPCKDKKKKIDEFQKAVKDFAEEIMSPMLKADDKFRKAVLEYSKKRDLRTDREAVMTRLGFDWMEQDLSDLSPEDWREMFEYATKMAVENVQKPVPAPAPVIQPTPELKIKGLRKDWKFEIINPQLVPRQFLQVAYSLIDTAVKGGTREIPGVRIYEEESIR